MQLVRCDTCGLVVDQPGRLPDGWSLRYSYQVHPPHGAMLHRCPECSARAAAGQLTHGARLDV